MSNMNLALYTMADEYVQAMQRLPEMGLDEQTIADTLEGLQGNVIVKAQQVAAYTLNIEAEADAIEQAIHKLQTRRDTIRDQAGNLRAYLHKNMGRTGITEIKAIDGTFKAKIKQNPPKVEITDQAALPEIYLRTIPETVQPDKQAIAKALKAGDAVPGAELSYSERLEIS